MNTRKMSALLIVALLTTMYPMKIKSGVVNTTVVVVVTASATLAAIVLGYAKFKESQRSDAEKVIDGAANTAHKTIDTFTGTAKDIAREIKDVLKK